MRRSHRGLRIDKRKKNADMHRLLDELRFANKKGQLDKSKIVLEELKEKYALEPIVMFEEALYLTKFNDIEKSKEALVLLEKLADSNVRNKEAAAYEYIKQALYVNELSEKIELYCNRLLDNEYNTGHVEYYLARYYDKTFMFEKAKKHYNKAIELGEDNAKIHLANLEFQLNRSYKSNVIDNIMNKSDNNIAELELKIKFLFKNGKINDIKECLNLYESEMKTKYMNTIHIYYLFNQYLRIGKLNKAEEIVDKYSWFFDEIKVNYFKGRIALCKENYEEATRLLSLVASTKNDFTTNSLFYLAKISEKFKNYDNARKLYHEMYKIATRSDEIKIFLIQLDICENKFDDARKLYSELKEETKKMNYVITRQLNALLNHEKDESQHIIYSVEQILNYNLNDAIDHISRHTIEEDLDGQWSKFNPNIDIEEVVLYSMDKINDMEPDFFDNFEHYIIEYPNVGFYNEYILNYLHAVVIPQTNKILTLFPINTKNIFLINSLEDNSTIKGKRKSQIEKFNDKYKIYEKRKLN